MSCLKKISSAIELIYCTPYLLIAVWVLLPFYVSENHRPQFRHNLEMFPLKIIFYMLRSKLSHISWFSFCLDFLSLALSPHSTGRWRSDWSITFPQNPSGASATVKASTKVQSHLFEDGNVQLISSKETNHTITVTVSTYNSSILL